MSNFQKAIRKQARLRIALIGPSGSGKTYSALTIAGGMGGKIALLDTEARRSEYYADKFNFDVMHLEPPFSPERYIEAIDAAVAAGYDTLIIDSASHEWIGKGGCLEIVDNLKRTQANSYTLWGQVTPRHNAFIDKIVTANIHIILCLRGKDEYILETNERGKQAPKKVGMGAQMRDGLEYECTLALMLDISDHAACVMKDNTGVFEGNVRVITAADGCKLMLWANSGAIDNRPVAPAKYANTTGFNIGDEIENLEGKYLGTVILAEGNTVGYEQPDGKRLKGDKGKYRKVAPASDEPPFDVPADNQPAVEEKPVNIPASATPAPADDDEDFKF